MLKNPIVRSLLQIAGLSVVALFLTTASPKAAPAVGLTAVSVSAASASAFDECDDEYEQCVERCGTWDWYWDGTYIFVGGEWVPNFIWGWHADIDYFECVPGWRYGDCECSI